MSTLKETWSRYVTMVWSFIWPKKYVLVWFGEHFQYLWGFFHNFELKYHQFTPIELQRFSQKGYCTFFFGQSKLIWTYNSILQKYQNISTKKYHFYFLRDRGSFSWFSAHTFPICSFSIFSSEGYCAFYFYQAEFIYPSKSILGR